MVSGKNYYPLKFTNEEIRLLNIKYGSTYIRTVLYGEDGLNMIETPKGAIQIQKQGKQLGRVRKVNTCYSCHKEFIYKYSKKYCPKCWSENIFNPAKLPPKEMREIIKKVRLTTEDKDSLMEDFYKVRLLDKKRKEGEILLLKKYGSSELH